MTGFGNAPLRGFLALCGTLLLLGSGCAVNNKNSPDGKDRSSSERRIIDVHLHAFSINQEGFAPGIIDQSIGVIDDQFEAPATDEELRNASIAALRERNVVKAIVSGRRELVDGWVKAAPDLLLRGQMIGHLPVSNTIEELSAEDVASMHRNDQLDVLGEITTQYLGIPPNDESLEPYFAVAAELGIPVHIHTAGVGAPVPTFRSAAGRPLLLEEVLTRHPSLRIYLENAGYPFLEDMLALFFQYPDRVYADVSTVIRIVPRLEFYRYLKVLVDAGFGDRIMFGSDQVIWPQAIGAEIDIIEEAPFLTDKQKDDIFYNNAVRFFGLEK